MKDLITIKEVTTRKEFSLFFQIPQLLFQDNKMWVPQLLSKEKNTLNPKKNPAFEHCKSKMFLAYKNNKVVGRIVGIINHKSNEIWSQERIRFGWIDFIDDKDVAQRLLQAVEEWGNAEGLTEIVGPMGFSNMDKMGMKVEGFDLDDPMTCYFTPEYYPKIMDEIGYQKEVDTIQYAVQGSQTIPEKVLKINNLIKEKYNLKIVEGISIKAFTKRYGIKVFETLNKSYAKLFGFVPLTEKQMRFYIKSFFTFLNLDLICFVIDENDDIVGFGFSMPSLVHALRKSKGKLFPFGWVHLLRALKKFDTINLLLTGVTPEWQNKGIHSLYHADMNTKYIKLGVKNAITNPQLETNEAHRVWQKYDSRIAARRRIFIKRL
jgi:hypothetical protein